MIEQKVMKIEKVSDGLQRLPDEKQLRDLGFENLAKKVRLQKFLAIACEHYLRLTEDAWEFINCGNNGFTTISIKRYCREIPPLNVLLALKQAQERKCFGEFFIALEGKDPILLGRVTGGCDDFSLGYRPFVIANWGKDFNSEWLENSKE